MSEEVAVAIPEPAAVETKEGIIPDGLLQDPSVAMAGGDAGMGTLANAAVDAKRPGEHIEDEGSAAKKARYSAADPAVWESLMNQVRTELRSMTSDECFSRALELQMLARSEVGARSQHLSNAMDLMATNQQVVESPRTIIKTRNPPNMSISAAQQRATKADREVSKQKPIKTNKAAPVPCMKMTPPLPPRCEVDNAPNVELPQFCQLVNFPTARYYGNCVMCDEAEFPIPKQNKGVCNNCDVAIWVVNPSGMNIKWCKGCKNFRKWIDFGVKGYSSKCERCRQQQAARYANQKTKGAETLAVASAPIHPTIPIANDPASVAAEAAAAAATAAAVAAANEPAQMNQMNV